jgi:hypothetical protein
VPDSDAIMFNDVMYLVDQQYKEEKWNWLGTIPVKKGIVENGFVHWKDIIMIYRFYKHVRIVFIVM